MRKWCCDICGKETDGILEHFEYEVSFITNFGTFDEKDFKIEPCESVQVQDVCLDCQKTIGTLINSMKEVKRQK